MAKYNNNYQVTFSSTGEEDVALSLELVSEEVLRVHITSTDNNGFAGYVDITCPSNSKSMVGTIRGGEVLHKEHPC